MIKRAKNDKGGNGQNWTKDNQTQRGKILHPPHSPQTV